MFNAQLSTLTGSVAAPLTSQTQSRPSWPAETRRASESHATLATLWWPWPRSAFCAARQRASHISIEPSCAPVAAVSLRTSIQFSATEQLPLNRSSSVAVSQIFVAWSQEHVQS